MRMWLNYGVAVHDPQCGLKKMLIYIICVRHNFDFHFVNMLHRIIVLKTLGWEEVTSEWKLAAPK